MIAPPIRTARAGSGRLERDIDSPGPDFKAAAGDRARVLPRRNGVPISYKRFSTPDPKRSSTNLFKPYKIGS